MQQSDPKSFRKQIILNIIKSIILFILVFIFGMSMLIGYKLDFKNIKFEPTSLVRVSPVQSGVDVYVNNNLLNWWSNDKIDVVMGQYKIRITKNGYMPYEKVIDVEPHVLYWVTPNLIPVVKQYEVLKSYDSLSSTYSSNDRKAILVKKAENVFELVDTSSSNVKYREINLATYYPNLAEKKFEFYNFITENYLLFKNSTDKNDLILVKPKKPELTISLTSVIAKKLNTDNVTISKVDFINDHEILVLINNALYKTDIENSDPMTVLATNVNHYDYVRDGVIVFNNQSGLHLLNSKNEVITLLNKPNLKFQAVKYRDNIDFIAYIDENRFEIIQGELKNINKESNLIGSDSVIKKIVSRKFEKNPNNLVIKQGRFVALDFGNIKVPFKTEHSLQSNMALIEGNNKMQDVSSANESELVPSSQDPSYVYDLEYKTENKIALNWASGDRKKVDSLRDVRWLDENYVWENINGVVRVKTYDSQNQYKLIPALNHDIQMSYDGKYIYFFKQSETNKSIEFCRVLMSI